jgi:hypothetical protein
MPGIRLTRLVRGAIVGWVVGCTHNVAPKVTPSRIASVQPPIHSRALLVLTPSFESYTSESQEGIHHFNYHLGASASAALQDLVTASFDSAVVQRVGDADLMRLLTAPPDASAAAVMLVPHFSTGGAREGFFTVSADVALRLDVRSARGSTYSWTGLGHTSRAVSSRRGLTGSALEQALQALSDSLGAHRADLEGGPAPGP